MSSKEETLKILLAKMLGVEVDQIKDDSSPETIPSWDSLKHMNLVIAVENEFGVQFTDDQIVDSMSYKTLKEIIL